MNVIQTNEAQRVSISVSIFMSIDLNTLFSRWKLFQTYRFHFANLTFWMHDDIQPTTWQIKKIENYRVLCLRSECDQRLKKNIKKEIIKEKREMPIENIDRAHDDDDDDGAKFMQMLLPFVRAGFPYPTIFFCFLWCCCRCHGCGWFISDRIIFTTRVNCIR